MNNDQALAVINDKPERATMFADMLACFKAFNLRVIGSLHDGLLVQKIKYPIGGIFVVSDNGGEVNVERVNDHTSLRSLPYVHNRSMIDGATLAYRVRCGIDGDAVDYARSYAEDLDDLKKIGV